MCKSLEIAVLNAALVVLSVAFLADNPRITCSISVGINGIYIGFSEDFDNLGATYNFLDDSLNRGPVYA